MKTDKRYNHVKHLCKSKHIKRFSQVLDVLPKTIISRDLAMHHQTFNSRIVNPDDWVLKELYAIAALIGIDRLSVIKLVLNEDPANNVSSIDTESDNLETPGTEIY